MRADVDNLGRLISRGIHRGEYTFSRMASVSRLLNLFFKLGVNGLCRGRIEGGEPVGVVKRGGERNLAVVYSGGDDLFIAGAYDEVLELAFDISRAFRRFVGGNPDVTLSGGIV
ncbi:type III-A CRISPR-associated protein Cas10/Csm1, partial [Candidatus Poribacteria bacterium]